jgi:hypothetical protein
LNTIIEVAHPYDDTWGGCGHWVWSWVWLTCDPLWSKVN